jgi:hypothetical protein
MFKVAQIIYRSIYKLLRALFFWMIIIGLNIEKQQEWIRFEDESRKKTFISCIIAAITS